MLNLSAAAFTPKKEISDKKYAQYCKNRDAKKEKKKSKKERKNDMEPKT